MEFTTQEMTVVELAAGLKFQSEHSELNDFQLAMIGGGCGDTIAF